MTNPTLRSGKVGLGDPDSGPPVYRDLVLLGGFCLFLSALDHLIPKPLPFMRIGLANLPLLIALDIFSAKQFFLLALIKVLGQGLVTGSLFSYVALFSLAGTALSAALMFVLRRAFFKNTRKGFSLIGIGIAGAFVSNAVQLALARFIVFGEGVRYLAPPFLAAGIVSGGLLGFFAELFSAQSEWLRLKREEANPALPAAGASNTASPDDALEGHKSSTDGRSPTGYADASTQETQHVFSFWSVILLFLALLFLLVPWLPVRAALFLLFWLLTFTTGKKTRPVFTIIGIVMITACNLFPPFGKILFRVGPVIVAEGSLMRGLQRAVTMEGLIMFSRLALTSAFPLPGTLGRLLRETFAVLEQLNGSLSDGDKTSLKSNAKKGKTGKLLQNMDSLLCEMSGYRGFHKENGFLKESGFLEKT